MNYQVRKKQNKDIYKTTRAAINWQRLGFKPVQPRCQFLAPRSGALYKQESWKVQRATPRMYSEAVSFLYFRCYLSPARKNPRQSACGNTQAAS